MIRPVKGNFGCQAARARYFEDEVEAVFNGGEHQNGGNGNADDTDGGQLGGSVNEFGKYWLTSCSMVGTKLRSRNSFTCSLTPSKTGKAEKIARPIAKSGTTAMSEV